MLVTTMISPVSLHLVEQESGTSPDQTGKIKQLAFIVWKHKLFSVIHIVLGVALGIVSLIGMSCDIIAKENYKDCLRHGHTLSSCNDSLLEFDIPCLICSLFVHGFQLCSLIGSLVLAPTMAYLGYLGAIKDVIVVNSTQFQVISTANVEPAIMTIEEKSYQKVQNQKPQQYQVMKTNEPEGDYIQE
ncbi:unnamed protein product [Mytilus coruscus]|uniref:Uncharacterized protein n=1 Tax=Mytilus coruscus TaxID=42192 RepID=A0A6J8C9B8_MYTCO|nr:unnamed protein product [Mytilus coruscus]